MKTSNKLLLATLISHTIAAGTFAAVPHTFSAGSPALASEVNENFSQLDSRLEALEGSEANSNSYITVQLDCSENAKALVEALEGTRNSSAQMEYQISGACEGAEIARADVRIDGSGNASITEGDDMDGESLFIDAQANVRLSNLTLEGTLFVRNSSNLRLENVVLPMPAENDDEYEPNIYMRTSYLRINTGSINNLSLLLNRNASADIRSAVTGNAYQVVADGNSTIVIQSETATYDTVEAVASSFVHSHGNLIADDLYASRGSAIEASSLQVTDFVDIWGNSHLYVHGDVTVGTGSDGRFNVFQNSAAQVAGNLSAGEMECSNSSSFDIDGNLETRGSLSWSGGQFGLAIQRGCFGRYGESESNTLTGGYFIDQHSEVYTPSWAALSE
ncbi:hypothetical protein ACQKP3_05835 [Vibrio sp. DNB22_10_4]